MKIFSGWEYLLIDAANNYGLDKSNFETRIEWAESNLTVLEQFAESVDWKERPLYIAAVHAIRAAQRGEPTGHLVGFDAVCSGMQIMSVLTGCVAGATATGLVDPNNRTDAYTLCTDKMAEILGCTLTNQRDKVKQACMTSLYGSKKEPELLFGKDSKELSAFYTALYTIAPGACQLLQLLINSWKPYAKIHDWILPDGFLARCKVYVKTKKRIEIDELNHASFSYVYYENQGERKGVKNAANVIHSIDAYILRSLVRRCSYDPAIVNSAGKLITAELLARSSNILRDCNDKTDSLISFIESYRATSLADLVILPHLNSNNLGCLSTDHLRQLNNIISSVLKHPPFPIVSIHDDFKCHPNNMNQLRTHYKEILCDLADSDILDDILSQLYDAKGEFPKLSEDLSNKIQKSNYGLS